VRATSVRATSVRGVARRIDHLGRIVVPVEYRRVLGITEGDELDLTLEGDAIAIRRNGHACALCGGIAELVAIRSRWVCSPCRRDVVASTEQHG
jgi:AbrB family transcriptional regulator, transcriptional pleiotropic regulator of transition state genes